MLMNNYVLYGLGIHSELPLWAVPVEECPADVTIRWASGNTVAPMDRGRVVEESGDEIRLEWSGIARVRLRAGREIIVERGPKAEDDHLRFVVGGLCLGLLLHQRGLCTLHASVVAVDGAAVLFAGSKGCGKSTTAAAMRERGHFVLADDVAAIDVPDDEPPRLIPGMPSLSLWPDAVLHLGEDSLSWPRVWPHTTKRARHLETSSGGGALPLKCIFLLEPVAEGARPVFHGPLPLVEAFTALIGHSHAYRMLKDPGGLPRYSRQCTRIAESVPVVRLQRPLSLDSLSGVASEVEEFVATLARSNAPATASAGS